MRDITGANIIRVHQFKGVVNIKLTEFHTVANLVIYINLAELVSIHPSVDPNAKTVIVLSTGQQIYVKETMEYIMDHIPNVSNQI